MNLDCTTSPGTVAAATDNTTRDRGRKSACLLLLTKKAGGGFLSKLLPRYMAASSSANPAVRALVQRMVQDIRAELTCKPTNSDIKEPHQVLECPSCEGFTSRPVCLPCGHSICKSCLQKPSEEAKNSVTCCCCKKSFSKVPVGFAKGRSPTLLLQSVAERCYPTLLECCALREEGNQMANEGNLPEAIVQYTKALDRAVGSVDHRVLSNRSKVYFDSGMLPSALQDAETCCSLRPYWSKGHYRRGVVLQKMDRLREAAGSFLLCAHFNDNDLSALKLLHAVVDRMMKEGSTDKQDLVLSVVCFAKSQFESFLARHNEEFSNQRPAQECLIDVSDFDCVLCASLLYKPVTVPCGHSFCQSCLARTFDHTPYCPVCRSPLGETFRQHTENSGRIMVDSTMEELMQLCFPQQYKEKEALIEQDRLKGSRVGLSDDQAIPIFVCTMAYPGIPCPLHIFEPRYRLMIRRCTESNSRRFGMCLPLDDQASSYVDFGTVLFISSLEYTPDGRSLVTTLGERRFQVLERGSSDGYAVAKIQFISDKPVEGENNIAMLRSLQQSVYDHAMQWFNALPPFTRLMIVQNTCQPPPPIDSTPETCPNGPAWVWWFVNVVPASLQTKLAFLSSISLHERLLMLKEALPLPTITS